MPRPDARLVAIELHDVAPATWPDCAAILRMLDAAGASNVSLLVVPRFHGRGASADDAAFVGALDARLSRGDELVLHGLVHRDDAPAPRSLRGFVQRRVMTRSEGEFAALDEDDAARRLAAGIAMFDALGWPLQGFVPPAWLLSGGARKALAQCGDRLRYVSMRAGLHRLPDWRFTPSANLCYSPDRPWRRAVSRALIRRELHRAVHLPMLRLSIHPQDAREPVVMRHWCTLVEDALAHRRPVTKREWAAMN
jgi:predicted deacetylase